MAPAHFEQVRRVARRLPGWSALLLWSACGQIRINNNAKDQIATCTLGTNCVITLTGSGLGANTELMVSNDCSSGISVSAHYYTVYDDPLRNPPDTFAGNRFTFEKVGRHLNNDNVPYLSPGAGWYMLCWRQVASPHDKRMTLAEWDPPSWRHVGQVFFQGPPRSNFICNVGEPCSLSFEPFMPKRGALRLARRGCMEDQYESYLDTLGLGNLDRPLEPTGGCAETCSWVANNYSHWQNFDSSRGWATVCLPTFADGACSACAECSEHAQAQPGVGYSAPDGLPMSGRVDFDLGVLPRDATPGSYVLRWCPDATNCAEFWQPVEDNAKRMVAAGFLELQCPPGTMQVGFEHCHMNKGGYSRNNMYDGRFYCRPCPVGYYCTGGVALNGHELGWDMSGFANQHRLQTACPEDHSTATTGSSKASHCVCDAGKEPIRNRGALTGLCELCAVGKYKSEVADDSCDSCESGTTTNRAGATAKEECTAVGAVALGGNSTQTPVVLFTLIFRQTQDSRTRREPYDIADIQAYFASVLAIPLGSTSKVSESFDPPDATRGQYTFELTLQLLMKNQLEVTRTLDSFDDTLAPLTRSLSVRGWSDEWFYPGDMEITWTPATTGSAPMACAEEGRAAIPGVFVTDGNDFEVCQCMQGYGDGTGSGRGACTECALGQYKPSIGNTPCQSCSPGRTTFQLGSLTAAACVCPLGTYTTTFSDNCIPCEVGYYCPDGFKVRCPAFSRTMVPGATNVTDCLCNPGYWQDEGECIPCEAGKYKQTVGNDKCDEVCPSGATTDPGASSKADCQCVQNFHAKLDNARSLVSCVPCNYEGLECKGGFVVDPAPWLGYAIDGQRLHVQPAAKSGFFQTGTDIAVRCTVFDEDGESVCEGGGDECLTTRLGLAEDPQCHGPWGNKCSEEASGMLCGSCPSGRAREYPLEHCEECPPAAGLYAFLSSGADLLAQSATSLLLAAAAVASQSRQTQSLHSALLRIASQWFAACSVITQFDLSRIQAFGWAQASAELEWRQENCQETDCGRGPLALFEWPEEVSRVLNAIFWMVGLVPTLGNVEQNLACTAGSSAQAARVVPALYVLAYPVLLMLACLLLSALLVYCILPAMKRCGLPTGTQLNEASRLMFVQSLCSKQRKRMEPRLNAYGLKWSDLMDGFLPRLVACYEGEFVSTLLGEKSPEDVIDGAVLSIFLSRMRPALQPEMEKHGVDWPRTRALASHRFPSASALMERRDELQKVATLAAVLAKDYSELDEDERTGLLQASEADADDAPEERGPAAGRYLGLFTPGPGLPAFLRELMPVLWAALHTIWPWLLMKFLQMIWCEPTPQGAAGGGLEIKQRLVQSPDVVCGSDEHMPLAIVATAGLLLWVVGIPVALFLRIWALGDDRQHPDNARHFGYFFFGYEPHAWWWDIIVKRIDVGLMMCVAYTSIADDAKARLLLFPLISGLFLFITAWFRPFDDRWSGILDYVETASLAVRFALFSCIALLLIFNTTSMVTGFFAILITAMVVCFVVFIVFHIVVQIVRKADDEGEDAGEEIVGEAVGEAIEGEEDEADKDEESGDPCSIVRKQLNSCIKCLVMRSCGAAVNLVSDWLQLAEEEQLRLTWAGGATGGLRVSFPSPKRPVGPALRQSRRVRAWMVYKSRSKQRRAVSDAMGAFEDLWINHFDQEHVPALLDSLAFVLAAAFRLLPLQTPPNDVPKDLILRSRFIVAHMEDQALSPDDLVGVTIRFGHMKRQEAELVVQELEDLLMTKVKNMPDSGSKSGAAPDNAVSSKPVYSSNSTPSLVDPPPSPFEVDNARRTPNSGFVLGAAPSSESLAGASTRIPNSVAPPTQEAADYAARNLEEGLRTPSRNPTGDVREREDLRAPSRSLSGGVLREQPALKE